MDDLTFDDAGQPFATSYGDHFYSTGDGRAEAAHVFLAGNGLPERWANRQHFTIGELGFGTGLNALVAWQCWRETRKPATTLEMVSLDAHPMTAAQAERALAHWPDLKRQPLLDQWNRLSDGIALDDTTRLRVIHAEAEAAIEAFPTEVDAWFLDGFAPAKNPAMWSAPLMHALAARTAPGGTFASYTAAGWVRRNLQDAGFAVDRIEGYGGKRHMIRGTRA